MSQERVHIFFSGRVQGVGFRFFMQSLAHQYHLTGWVKNLSDGRVESHLQGESENICACIQAAKHGNNWSYVSHTELEKISLRNETEFKILHY